MHFLSAACASVSRTGGRKDDAGKMTCEFGRSVKVCHALTFTSGGALQHLPRAWLIMPVQRLAAVSMPSWLSFFLPTVMM